MSGFKKLAQNPNEISECYIFITYQSIINNFESVFGCTHCYFPQMLYYYLSDGFDNRKIRFLQFSLKMKYFNTFDPKRSTAAICSMYDMNKDGEVTIIDLMHIQANVPDDCQYGKEVHSLVNEYSNILMKKMTGGGKVEITKYLFYNFLGFSCIIPELLQKLFGKSHWLLQKIGKKESIFLQQKTKHNNEKSQERLSECRKRYINIYKEFFSEESIGLVKHSFGRLSKNIFEFGDEKIAKSTKFS